MAKSLGEDTGAASQATSFETVVGNGGELHQIAGADGEVLTTQQGIPVADDQNHLKIGERGPALLEDFHFREKIFHFDHERIPERVVHARGFGAHGYFELTESLGDITTAKVLSEVGEKTPMFVRFSTVAGNKGSPDLARDVRGFAVKFYTKEGNWDIVGNNIPVFFIQDAIKFPDLIHAAKQEPDRGFPQAQTAHDNFWDFIADAGIDAHDHVDHVGPHHPALVPHDRGLRRPHLPADQCRGQVHLRQVPLEAQARHAVGAVERGGEDQRRRSRLPSPRPVGRDHDGHASRMGARRPAVRRGLRRQLRVRRPRFDQADPRGADPARDHRTLVLDRVVDNFFAETEQVAFCTQNVVPGIDFTNDPLLQGRNFSYLDTQLKRLGGPNFTHIPINAPKVPVNNFQQDGHMAMRNPKGRANYEPNSWAGPRESPTTGYKHFAAEESGRKAQVRSASFADHYSQARQFFISQSDIEQKHIGDALVFELSKCERVDIRESMVGHLLNIHEKLATVVATGLGLKAMPAPAKAAVETRTDLPPSDALSIAKTAKGSFEGRKLGILVTDGAEAAIVTALIDAVVAAKAVYEVITPKVAGATLDDGTLVEGKQKIDGGPSILYDAVALVLSVEGAAMLAKDKTAKDFVSDAFGHSKFIGYTADALPLIDKAGIGEDDMDAGLIELGEGADAKAFLTTIGQLRLWDRELTTDLDAEAFLAPAAA